MPQVAVEMLIGLIPLVAVIVTHILSQRAGEKRANQVRVELAERIDTLDKRLTEVRDVLDARMTESKLDLTARISDLKAHTDLRFAQVDSHFSQVRNEIAGSATGIKELFSSEMRVLRAEILAALPQRARGASTDR